MQIKDIMTKDVMTIPQDASLKEAAMKMKDLNVGSIPVVDGKKVIGLLTDRDIVVRSTAAGHDPNEVTAKDVMTKTVMYCFSDQDVKDAAEMMGKKQIRRLPILDRDMQLVGIVSLGDISVDSKGDKLSAEALEKISRPAKPER